MSAQGLDRVGLYLWSRGLSGQRPELLEFAPALEYRDPDGKVVGEYPAMVAPLVNLAGEPMSAHRTYLDPDGLGKADLAPARKLTPAVVEGGTMGAAVRLDPAGPVLALAEGIETALAVREATGRPTWATVSANGLERVELPPAVRQVEIWADHDASGRGQVAAGRLVERLHQAGLATRVLCPAHLGTDWLDVYAAQGRAGLLRALASGPPGEVARTDLGNARRLVRLHGLDLRHDCHLGHWYVWGAGCWALDTRGAVARRAKDTIREVYREAADADEDDRKQLVRHALKSEGAARVRAMVELAATEPELPVTSEDWDPDPWVLNCANGTIDLRTGRLRPHQRRDLCTKQVPHAYHPAAPAPRWRAFVAEVMEQDQELVGFLHRAAGYSITGRATEDCFFLHYGPQGRNGKSTFFNVLRRVLGGYSTDTSPATFMEAAKPSGSGATPELAKLQGARLVTAQETGDGQRLDEGLVKSITGRDPITARFLYQRAPVTFEPGFKVHLSTNHRPHIDGQDKAIWARVRLVPWRVSFYGREDRGLEDELEAEAEGILAWLVSGCLAWQRHGLGMAEAVQQETTAYQEDMDTMGRWIEDCCTTGPDHLRGAGAALYASYKDWAKANGVRAYGMPRWSDALQKRGHERKRSGGRTLYVGLTPAA